MIMPLLPASLSPPPPATKSHLAFLCPSISLSFSLPRSTQPHPSVTSWRQIHDTNLLLSTSRYRHPLAGTGGGLSLFTRGSGPVACCLCDLVFFFEFRLTVDDRPSSALDLSLTINSGMSVITAVWHLLTRRYIFFILVAFFGFTLFPHDACMVCLGGSPLLHSVFFFPPHSSSFVIYLQFVGLPHFVFCLALTVII